LHQLEDALEGFRFTGVIEIDGERALPSRDALFLEHPEGLAGYGGSRVDDLDLRTGQPFDDRPEERVMGAAQYYDIGPFLQ
jgi:hypothetical protein